MPVHIPHGMEPKAKINVPAFYLLDQYLKAKSTEVFDVANRDNLPVLQTGRYQNLTHSINVSNYITMVTPNKETTANFFFNKG